MGKIGFCDHCKRATTILKPGELKTYKLYVADRNQDRQIKQAELCNECYKGIATYFEMSDTPIQMREEPAPHPKAGIKLAPGTRTHHCWTKEEDDFIKYHSAGLTKAQLAEKFGVTIPAINKRRWQLLSPKSDS